MTFYELIIQHFYNLLIIFVHFYRCPAAYLTLLKFSLVKDLAMANSSSLLSTVPREILISSVVFKFIALIIGVLGNITVIIYTTFTGKRKTATSYLIGNLALADLLVCLTSYPIWMIELIQTILNIDSDQELFCKLSHSIAKALLFASVA